MEKHKFIGRHGFMHICTDMNEKKKYPYFDIRIEKGFKLFFIHWIKFCWYIGWKKGELD